MILIRNFMKIYQSLLACLLPFCLMSVPTISKASEEPTTCQEVPADYEQKHGFEFAGCISDEGLIRVKPLDSDNWGYANIKGEMIIAPTFYSTDDFYKGLAIVSINNYQKGVIDTTGNFVLKPIYYFIRRAQEGLMAVQFEEKWGYVNTKGETVIDFNYDAVNDFSEGLSAVARYKYPYDEQFDIQDTTLEWGYIDKTGKLVIPFQYEYAFEFRDGMARIKENRYCQETSDDNNKSCGGERYGYIDKIGKLVIPFQYKYAEDFNEGKAEVDDNYYMGWDSFYIDKTGQKITD